MSTTDDRFRIPHHDLVDLIARLIEDGEDDEARDHLIRYQTQLTTARLTLDVIEELGGKETAVRMMRRVLTVGG